MVDRVEREIEEILAKLDGLPDEAAAEQRKPISILDQRDRRRKAHPQRQASPRRPLRERLNPTALLVGGAGTVIGGLVLSNLWAPLIWAAFGGVLVFLGGFLSAFFRRPQAGAPAKPGGAYWRDRYIQYEPTSPGAWGRFRKRFRH